MSFDQKIDRRGTHCSKWDSMETLYGVSPEDGLAMWVADMDFRPPQCVQDAVQAMVDHGVYGYFGDESKYRAAIQWWMQERHGWAIESDWIFSLHGLVNGTAMCVETYTKPGDGVILFTPVYHAFARVIKAADREVVEMELVNTDGHYTMDFDAYDAAMTGNEKMVILCSPHNPGGRVWTREELQQVADFCKRHDLILVSDEIHHDLTYGAKHTAMSLVDPSITDRLVMMTAATKTFNIAGSHIGNVIIEDPDLRARFAKRMAGLGLSPNSFGLFMVTAAYTPEGAKWVDELMAYLAENQRIFNEGINVIPGLKAMPLEATYLSWVDFAGTGMPREEFTSRVQDQAKIAVNHGPTFGKGGESFLRFNIAAPRAIIEDAVARMQAAFSDLQ
ncbi:MalY/PatB family protein [Cognatishimia sp. MH4019]|uniref:MalY/PatB family protein n=1 Tax=Cognatishimia sp. MH4019 TaxID=2854030 RepID=UPI001CD67CAA|nr:MalY/PatB family protein [Cognatishimia sp. MH4019]